MSFNLKMFLWETLISFLIGLAGMLVGGVAVALIATGILLIQTSSVLGGIGLLVLGVISAVGYIWLMIKLIKRNSVREFWALKDLETEEKNEK